MMDRIVSRLLIAALAAGLFFCTGSTAAAQDDERETAREEGPVVRHQLLYRSTRVELVPMLGITLGDAYTRNLMGGASASYHLTNSFGFTLMGAGGFANLETSLRENVEQTVDTSDLSYSHIQGLAGLELSYAPITGKFSIFNDLITDFDFHLLGGFALVFEGAEPAADGGEVDATLEGMRPAPQVGLGARFFLGDGMALNLQLRNYLYSTADVSTDSVDPEFKNNTLFTLGMSFFLPQEVKISR